MSYCRVNEKQQTHIDDQLKYEMTPERLVKIQTILCIYVFMYCTDKKFHVLLNSDEPFGSRIKRATIVILLLMLI